MATNESARSHENTLDAFVRETMDLVRKPTEETLTPFQVAEVYRRGFSFAEQSVGFPPLQSVLFAMSYGKYVLGHFNEWNEIETLHAHEGRQPYAETIRLPSPRKASESATQYLRSQFRTTSISEASPSFISILDNRYRSEGVVPTPSVEESRISLYIGETLIFTPQISDTEFVSGLRQLGVGSSPDFVAQPARYTQFHDEVTGFTLAEFQRLLEEVESGAYLMRQEGINPNKIGE